MGTMLRRMEDAPVLYQERNMRKDSCQVVMESVQLMEEDVMDRTKWRRDMHQFITISAIPNFGKSPI